ncbi:MAG TPA: DUF2461 domain-containing protein [Gemmatimonadaceae bacterium]|nr:DUF2461 domain-containing protein [Gemmatimonadaceae bacterium]
MPFTKRSLTFFRQLARNNEKSWFEAHRTDYENEVRAPMRELIEELDARFAEFAPEIGGDTKRSMFRINRDIRFSKDKSPYKTHAAAWFHHRNAARAVGSEADAGSAGYYFHLEPGGRSLIGGGLWMPPRQQLNKLRTAIADDPRGFGKMVGSIPRRFGGLDDESMLKRMPRGYDEDHPAAKWLRYQSFTTGRGLTDAQVTSASLATLLAKEFEAILPLVRWLNSALGFRPADRR